MTASTAITFKTATESWEFEQISILNYRTFVEEIPQHEADDSGVRVDPFHPENTYVIALRGRDLIGMIAVRDTRPFSLDLKLPNLDSYLPPASSICELRLLAVHPDHRNGVVFRGMGRVLRKHCLEQGYDLAIMSGTVRQKKLYSSLGFEAFGPPVGSPSAPFQPMYLTPERFVTKQQLFTPPTGRKQPVNFLPGPVESSPEVHRAFRADSVSHRAERFMQDFEEMRASLAKFVNARHVQILLGSGTLANDAVGACISLLGTRGVVLSNGEFGRRLVDQATRFRMRFDTVEVEWGDAFDYSDVERALSRLPSGGWLWAVHCETSTGVLNDLDVLKAICKRHDAHLYLDCVSSLGTGPLDLRGVAAASGASGKGLGAYPGLSMVFHEHDAVPSTSLPRYLDLGLYEAAGGVPFTQSSNLVYALREALRQTWERSGSGRLTADDEWLRSSLREMGLELVGPEYARAPAVTTFAAPEGVSSLELGQRLDDAGYMLSYRSGYLLERGWLQVCLMGSYSRVHLVGLLGVLREHCPRADHDLEEREPTSVSRPRSGAYNSGA